MRIIINNHKDLSKYLSKPLRNSMYKSVKHKRVKDAADDNDDELSKRRKGRAKSSVCAWTAL